MGVLLFEVRRNRLLSVVIPFFELNIYIYMYIYLHWYLYILDSTIPVVGKVSILCNNNN